MSVEGNAQLVEHLLDAFSHGEVERILAALADDLDWRGPVSDHPDALPRAARRRMPVQVADDVRTFATTSCGHPMEDVTYTASGDLAVVEGRHPNTARATGRHYEHQWARVPTIRNGQIARFRHSYGPAGDHPCTGVNASPTTEGGPGGGTWRRYVAATRTGMAEER